MRKFTLIELMVVVAIIGILISLLLPSIRTARIAAKATVCISNQKQISIATQSYVSTNDGLYPYSPLVDADSLPTSGYRPGKGRPMMDLIWFEAGETLDTFVCPLDESPEDFNLWYFYKTENYRRRKNKASYMFNEWASWLYGRHKRVPMRIQFVESPTEWPFASDGRIIVHGGELWRRGNYSRKDTGWMVVDWTHQHHKIGMLFGDGHVEHINSFTAQQYNGRPY